jgi:hypothetical protein
MNTNLKKIVKTAAVGIFFMALLMNVKVSLTDPFISISNEVIAQTTSSSSSSSSSGPTVNVPCDDVPEFGWGPYTARICLNGSTPYCKFSKHTYMNVTTGSCTFN